MARNSKPIVPITGTSSSAGSAMPGTVVRSFDRLMAVQRPAVLAHLRSIQRRHPDATPGELIRALERRYLAAVTTSGAAVGATAVIPAIGTVTTLALSGVETAAFLEATALFAQSVSEVHGLPVNEPDRARSLVMALMLGREGSELIRQWSTEAVERDVTRKVYWGEMVTSTLPRMVVGPLADRLKSAFVKRFAVQGGTGIVAKALPFGVGAVVGGAGNHLMGKRILQSSRLAFGPPPQRIDTTRFESAPRVMTARTAGRLRRRVEKTVAKQGRAVTDSADG
jgi:hypothetical protein